MKSRIVYEFLGSPTTESCDGSGPYVAVRTGEAWHSAARPALYYSTLSEVTDLAGCLICLLCTCMPGGVRDRRFRVSVFVSRCYTCHVYGAMLTDFDEFDVSRL